MHEVPGLVPDDITSLFQLHSFLCSFDYLLIPLNRSIDREREGGEISAPSTSRVSVELLSQVIDEKCGCLTFTFNLNGRFDDKNMF